MLRLQAVLAALIRKRKPIRKLIKILVILEEDADNIDAEQQSERIIAMLGI